MSEEAATEIEHTTSPITNPYDQPLENRTNVEKDNDDAEEEDISDVLERNTNISDTVGAHKRGLIMCCWTIPILLYDVLRLFCFVICLCPGFVRFTWYYCMTKTRTCIRYGNESCRQTLDVYSLVPKSNESEVDEETKEDYVLLEQKAAPVVLFYTGGAWTIGYKMWGALLARVLNASGIVVVIPDMRNYPWGTMPMMIDDVEQSFLWTLRNVEQFGGDPENIVMVGQSAGGHLASTFLLKRAIDISACKKQSNDKEPPSKINIKGFISLSAPYNFRAMDRTFMKHGFDANFVDHYLCGGKDQQQNFEPYHLVVQCQRDDTMLDLPPIQISHGTLDQTVPYDNAIEFYNELQTVAQGQVKFQSYDGWSHTDAILEGPMSADHRFHKDIFHAVKEWTDSDLIWPEEDILIQKSLCPRFLVTIGRFFNPF